MRKGDTYTFLFALGVCLACSLLLSVTAAALREKQALNVELDRKVNVLKALAVQVKDEDGKLISAEAIQRIFDEHIREVVVDREKRDIVPDMTIVDIADEARKAGELLPLYLWKEEDGTVTKYVFPVSGKGLWSTIRGYLALEGDLDTILGITFYEHGETPGLGGEIETEEFQSQFRGKTIMEAGELCGISVLKGKVADVYPDGNRHAVDGISGATMTSKGLNRFINKDLKNYDAYFTKLRKEKRE